MERIDEVTVFLATTRILLGVDFKAVDIVIFTSPFNDLAALLQGGGRGGRRRPDGMRSRVQVYQLWNNSDIAANSKVSPMMAQVCRSADNCCTTQQLSKHFAISKVSSVDHLDRNRDWCCHYCDTQL